MREGQSVKDWFDPAAPVANENVHVTAPHKPANVANPNEKMLAPFSDRRHIKPAAAPAT
jgi:hypothetical protein